MSVDATFVAVISVALKVIATAFIIIVVGRLARVAGPVLTSVLVALPVNAAPGLFFVSLAFGNEFVATGALYSMAGGSAVLVYLTVFVQAARS